MAPATNITVTTSDATRLTDHGVPDKFWANFVAIKVVSGSIMITIDDETEPTASVGFPLSEGQTINLPWVIRSTQIIAVGGNAEIAPLYFCFPDPVGDF